MENGSVLNMNWMMLDFILIKFSGLVGLTASLRAPKEENSGRKI
jgi:hypothetical protein